ncbi:MAG: hypothetical protein KC897_01280 [Candidatus Omnitrophica bacterium]|nr:hypothetical protein [Candidatus Omnitrophota bacterium]MCB9719615.1 hypothetical protein [Candidatus Omnitrophota bacterium]
MKKKTIGFFVLSATLIAALTFQYVQTRLREAEEYLSRESSPVTDMSSKMLLDAYAIYSSKKNLEKGTSGVAYFPCPQGFVCEDLLPPKFNMPAGKVVFDDCNGYVQKCIEDVKVFLLKSNIPDVDRYLEDRKRN